ncbi:MAG: ABC transporter permease subunit [Actinomycetota bacterium]|nr:ABC transporter permease subunit [Actinomycetota bacterium]
MQSLAGVDNELIDLLRSMGSSGLQIYRYVKLPASMPGFFSGLKIAATYSIMGEPPVGVMGGRQGRPGVYMIRAKANHWPTHRVCSNTGLSLYSALLLLKFIELIERKKPCPGR